MRAGTLITNRPFGASSCSEMACSAASVSPAAQRSQSMHSVAICRNALLPRPVLATTSSRALLADVPIRERGEALFSPPCSNSGRTKKSCGYSFFTVWMERGSKNLLSLKQARSARSIAQNACDSRANVCANMPCSFSILAPSRCALYVPIISKMVSVTAPSRMLALLARRVKDFAPAVPLPPSCAQSKRNSLQHTASSTSVMPTYPRHFSKKGRRSWAQAGRRSKRNVKNRAASKLLLTRLLLPVCLSQPFKLPLS